MSGQTEVKLLKFRGAGERTHVEFWRGGKRDYLEILKTRGEPQGMKLEKKIGVSLEWFGSPRIFGL